MLKSCSACGRIHEKNFDCGRRPKRSRWERKEEESGRYTYAFAKVSRSIKADSDYLCAVCLDRGVHTFEELEVYHIIKLVERPDLLLDRSNLICLCNRHHRMADEGKISENYLRELADRREHPPGGDVNDC